MSVRELEYSNRASASSLSGGSFISLKLLLKKCPRTNGDNAVGNGHGGQATAVLEHIGAN